MRRGPITVTWLAEDVGTPPRVAYAVSRRVGSAVHRNRLRRRLRAVVGAQALAPGAYLIAAGPGASELPYDELRSIVEKALTALGGRVPR